MVTVGSKYATELIYQAIFQRGRKMFENFVQAVNGDPILRKALGASGNVFEKFAHRLISGEQEAVESKFEVIFLAGGDGEDGMREIFFIGGNGEDGMRVEH